MKLIQLLCISTSIFLSLFVQADNTQPKNQVPSNFENKQSNNSFWQTKGYGYILEVKGDDIRFYDITKYHCLINHGETGEYHSSNIKIIHDKAVLEWGTLHPVELINIDKLPELCSQNLMNSVYDSKYTFNAVEVFDVFWYTFAEHYAFTKNWDWGVNYKIWKQRINAKTTEEALKVVFSELFSELDDGHAYLESKEGEVIAYHNVKYWSVRNRIKRSFDTQDEFSSFRNFESHTFRQWEEAKASYFAKNSKPLRLSRAFFLAKLKNNLSYFSIADMSEFTEEESIKADLEVVDRVMNQFLPFIHKSNGLIIDLRFNPGGYDLVSLQLLSYFINKPLHAGSKITKLTSGFSQPNNIVVEPAKANNFLGPITVLTSPLTISAAEVFTLGLAARGNVTFIGEPSNGSYSDTLPKQLPNGWTFALSNERYLDFKGRDYEFRGYPVSKRFEFFSAYDIKNGKDSALEEVVNTLK